MNNKKWLVDHEDSIPMVVEAPNEGTAVEFFLACRGMMGYDKLPRVVELRADDVCRWEEVSSILRGADFEDLQKHHTWRVR